MKLKQLIFNHACSRQLRCDITFPDYRKIVSVFLLYESEWKERNPQIRAMVQQLQEEDKQVICWGYCKKDKVLSPNLPESRILGKRDFNILQRPKSDVKQFLERHTFDLLLDLTAQPILPMEYVALYSKAMFKIGAHEAPMYNMVIPTPKSSDADFAFRQMIHYLKLIKSADNV